jgi:eukaryotic-like serine/threonine-protein kinase
VTTVRDALQRTLGSAYVLEREVGRGGMATVYLARDIKHNRNVALKVLDPELGAVLGAERFLSEIRVTAGLQHPNLLPLFDSGEAEGLLYYVMPFVEGESLRARLEREKQLPIEDAVRIATAVANALDYAHQHGVVHRDLKPENILLQHGQPVVVDFGIALAVSNAGGARVTQTGLSLGTPQYMSPEQATGDRAIDARTDVYSLGAVTYEMLAGEPPHSGTSAQAIIAKLMTTEPQPVRMLRPSVPPNVAMAVERALAKLPADRFGSAKAFADALSDPRFTTAIRSVESAPTVQRGRALELVFGGIALVSVVAAVWAWTRPTPVAPPARYNIDLDSGESILQSGRWGRIALSPDGSTIVYVGGPTNALMVRRRDELHAKKIPGTEQAGAPFFSPDGKHVGFFQMASKLMIVGFDGNPPLFVTDSLIGLAGATWGADDMLYIDGNGQTPLVRVAAHAGAKPTYFTKLDTVAGEQDQLLPNILPDDKGILFTAEIRPRHGNPIHHVIEIADPKSGEHHVLFENAVLARYASPGYIVYVTPTRQLMAVPFNLRSQKITGSPVLLAEDLSAQYNAIDATISQTGTLLYVSGAPTATGRDLVWVTRDGRATLVDSAWSASFADPAISPDGKYVAVTIGLSPTDVAGARASNIVAVAGGGDIWVQRLADGIITKLSLEGGINRLAAWSGDSKSVFYAGGQNGRTIVEKQADGGSAPVSRVEATDYVGGIAESADGQWLVFQAGAGMNTSHLFARHRGDSASVPLFSGNAATRSPVISPDGKWLAYVSAETGQNEVFVAPFPNVATTKWQVSRAGGTNPRWSNRGDELFYRAEGFLVSVPVSTKPTFSSGTPKRLFSAIPYLGGFAVSHDDQRFIMARSSNAGARERLSVFENWPATMVKK